MLRTAAEAAVIYCFVVLPDLPDPGPNRFWFDAHTVLQGVEEPLTALWVVYERLKLLFHTRM